jgi:hypothetical protein
MVVRHEPATTVAERARARAAAAPAPRAVVSEQVYESRLELARIMLADQDPDVASIAAQLFQRTSPPKRWPGTCSGPTLPARLRVVVSHAELCE